MMRILCSCMLVIISIQSKAQEKTTDNFPPPEKPIEIKARKAKNRILKLKIQQKYVSFMMRRTFI